MELPVCRRRKQAERLIATRRVSLASKPGRASRRSARDEPRSPVSNYGVTMYLDPEFTEWVMRNA